MRWLLFAIAESVKKYTLDISSRYFKIDRESIGNFIIFMGVDYQ